MTATVSTSSKDCRFRLMTPKNFVQTEVGRGFVDVFEPGLRLLEDVEDIDDAESTRRLYDGHGASAFLPHTP